MESSLRRGPEPGFGRLRHAAGFILGGALVAAAAWAAWSHGGQISSAWESLKQAPAPVIAAGAALPLANLVLTALLFQILNARYAPVRFGEMLPLIGAATLLNYLPLKPGMFGRIAWHKKYNGITVAESAKVLVWSTIASVGAIGLLLVLAAALSKMHGAAWETTVMVLCALVPTGVAAALWRRAPLSARIAVGASVRYFDTLVWAARYSVFFWLVGHPIMMSEAVALAAVSQAAMVVPIAGNGLGLREWAIGLTAAALPSTRAEAAGLDAAAIGLAADLVHRGVEVLVMIPTGGASALWLARIRKGRAAGADDTSDADVTRSDR